MSPTSYHCSTPHSLYFALVFEVYCILPMTKSDAKIHLFFQMTKFFFSFSCYCLIICFLNAPLGLLT